MCAIQRLMHLSQSVFAFENPIEFLNHQLKERQKKNPSFSLRAWARQVGYKNPSLLFQVLKGQRKLKTELATRLAANLDLKGKSLRYFELIVLNHASQSENEKKFYQSMIVKMKPKKFREINNLSVEVFSMASDWYHWAILVLTEFKDFSINESYIYEQLDRSVDKKLIKEAIIRLQKLGLLVQDENGKYRRLDTEENTLFMTNHIPSEAVRSYHEQMIEKAKASIRQQTIEERTLRGTTFAFSRENMEKAQEIIHNAHREILELASQSAAEEIYQFNTQFFRITKKRGETAK
jgi:uncharacterized protein (TIGR02147 family)